jgi:hypothetical protein
MYSSQCLDLKAEYIVPPITKPPLLLCHPNKTSSLPAKTLLFRSSSLCSLISFYNLFLDSLNEAQN